MHDAMDSSDDVPRFRQSFSCLLPPPASNDRSIRSDDRFVVSKFKKIMIGDPRSQIWDPIPGNDVGGCMVI